MTYIDERMKEMSKMFQRKRERLDADIKAWNNCQQMIKTNLDI
jgi:hypothetical protein